MLLMAVDERMREANLRIPSPAGFLYRHVRMYVDTGTAYVTSLTSSRVSSAVDASVVVRPWLLGIRLV